MARLTEDQILWLKTQRILPNQMFDASGLSAKDRVTVMKEGGFNFYYGGAVCNSGGHSLRTKAGHCMQCDTSKIAFQSRSSSTGYVYLAGSPQTKLIKVGMSSDLSDRERKINEYIYGGARDWEILLYARTVDAGRCEFGAHGRLEAHRAEASYVRAGRSQRCYELFECGFLTAKAALIASLPVGTPVKVANEARAIALFP